MSQKELWFRRNEDGVELVCNPGTVSHLLMKDNDLFYRIDGPGGDPVFEDPDNSVIVDLSGMSKSEQLELARTILEMNGIKGGASTRSIEDWNVKPDEIPRGEGLER